MKNETNYLKSILKVLSDQDLKNISFNRAIKTVKEIGLTKVNDPFLIALHDYLEEEINKRQLKTNELLTCPFCDEIPEFPDGRGTQYQIICECGKVESSVQICDFMTIEERQDDNFVNYKYKDVYIERAKREAVKNWNDRKKK